MYIEELSSRQANKYLTVTFSYEEIRDITNGLYHACHPEKKAAKSDLSKVNAYFNFLFDMVKHGMIQPETIRKFENGSFENGSEELDVTQEDFRTLQEYMKRNLNSDVFANADFTHSYALALKCMQAHIRPERAPKE